jgi:2-polyprenyl-6-methoxyphenol hydroxylase-like FAD-dependent oxidoreductase
MASSAKDHAVVVGASFAGAVTAGVLAGHFAQVTIVERDELPDGPAYRKGVPQSPHVHGTLKLGRDLLEQVFPGFIVDTEREGAFLFDQLTLGAGFTTHGWLARGRSSVRGYAARRPLLEHVARTRAVGLPNVDIVRAKVSALSAQGGRRVDGVVVTEADGATSRVIRADLVVDASGRGGGASAWLERSGFRAPRETVVNAFGGYASRLLAIPDEAWPGDMRYVAQLPMPSNTKGGILYPQDNGFYVMSLFGQSGDYPPADEASFLEFLAECTTPLMHHVVSRSEPLSEIRTSRATANRWRHFEEIDDPPSGFVVLGDAASCFNPMNGQGISTACLGAVTLGEVLTELDGRADRLPEEFQARLADRMVFPWRTAVGFDFQFPGTAGERPAVTPQGEARARYMTAVAQLATFDVEVAEAFFLSIGTFDPGRVEQPEVAAKVEAWMAGDRILPNADPARFPPLPEGVDWSDTPLARSNGAARQPAPDGGKPQDSAAT